MMGRALDASDLAQISPVWRRAADGVTSFAADKQIEVGSIGTERVIALLVNFFARLPPAVLAAYDTSIETFVDANASADTSLRGLDCHPIASGNASNLGRVRMEFNLWIPRVLAQTGQTTVLALAEKWVLRAG